MVKRWRSTAVAAVVLAACTGNGAGTPAPSSIPATSGSSTTAAGSGLLTEEVATQPGTQLSNGMIAYSLRNDTTGGYQVYLVDPNDGSNREVWTTQGQCPVYSPNGTILAYRTEGHLDVVRLSADGSPVDPINPLRLMGRCASFSPDGQSLAMVIDDPSTIGLECPSQEGCAPSDEGELSVIALDTGEPRPLGVRVGTAYTSYSNYPRVLWSPAGDELLLAENGNIRLVALDGTRSPLLLGGTPAASVPSFSPVGSTLAFARYDTLSGSVTHVDIWLADWPLRGERNLTSSPQWDEHSPVWSLDGQSIAFIRQECEGCAGQVVISDLNGELRALPNPDIPLEYNEGSGRFQGLLWQIWDLIWSPDGTRLAYRIGLEDQSIMGLVTVDADTGKPSVVVPTGPASFAEGISWQAAYD